MVERAESLGGLASWLAGFTWPLSRQQMLRSADERGWSVVSEQPKTIRWDTGMPPGASVVVLDDEVSELSIRTSGLVEDDAEGRRALRDTFADQAELVRGVLGAPTTTAGGRHPSATWALPNGSSLEVAAATRSCSWLLTSPEFVEIRRDLTSAR